MVIAGTLCGNPPLITVWRADSDGAGGKHLTEDELIDLSP